MGGGWGTRLRRKDWRLGAQSFEGAGVSVPKRKGDNARAGRVKSWKWKMVGGIKKHVKVLTKRTGKTIGRKQKRVGTKT